MTDQPIENEYIQSALWSLKLIENLFEGFF